MAKGKVAKRWGALLGLVVASASCAATPGVQSAFDAHLEPPATFEADGVPLCFVGANNYYLSYEPRVMVDDVLEAAQALGVKVVRTWAFIDRGSLDGSVASVDADGTKNGFYFQAWDPSLKHAVYNDGPRGLQGLDYALAKARQLNLKIVLVLTNNWREFGGMDQYLRWYGLTSHRDFYTEPRVEQAFKDWLWHVTSHVNVMTGQAYRDDPTIFAWELANEPRGNAGTPSEIITHWAAEMSEYLKSIDPQHLVAVGDEGFMSGASEHWTYHADNGVDHRALSALPNIDYATFHMYPDTWGTGFSWPEHWIDDHVRVARELEKPTVLEEYGLKVMRDELGRISQGLAPRLASYAAWNDRLLERAGNASMFWMLAGRNTSGGVYPDYDHFSVYAGDETSDLLRGYAERFSKLDPACSEAARSVARSTSPFVHVRGPRPRTSSWIAGAP